MLGLLRDLAPLVLGCLLAWVGARKLFGRSTPRQAADSALAGLLGVRRTTLVLRMLGAAELGIGAALLVRPGWALPAVVAAALGVGFVAYLAYARAVAPESSCGCTGARHAPITWRAFARAGLVVVGGLLAAGAAMPWWVAGPDRPLAAGASLVGWAALLAALSADIDRWWLLPLRRARLRLLGHPLQNTGGPVPVAATVELLEHSAAWQSTGAVVRSGLLEHWDSDGWRILRFAGVHGDRPVSVLFALDARDSTETTASPVVQVSVVDEERLQLIG